jgi:hypothetical protein
MVLMTGVYENLVFLYRTHKIFMDQKIFQKKNCRQDCKLYVQYSFMLGLRVFGVIKEMHMSAKKYEGC